MNKHDYIEKAFAFIRAKNLEVPFYLATGVKCPDLELYLASLKRGYLNSAGSVEELFHSKIEDLKKI